VRPGEVGVDAQVKASGVVGEAGSDVQHRRERFF
jgi:hypothetical protein